MILIINNYDSFTFNIVQYFSKLGAEVVVYRNDKISIDTISQLNPDYLVISPGPCNPDKAGISMQAIHSFAGRIPILGVCLGHQCIGQVFGGKVVQANEIMHGRVSHIQHNNTGIFEELPLPLQVTRYHSLIIEKSSLPDCLEVTSWSILDNVEKKQYDSTNPKIEIMGMRHKILPIESVQFHPESIMTESGLTLFDNFLKKYSQ